MAALTTLGESDTRNGVIDWHGLMLISHRERKALKPQWEVQRWSSAERISPQDL